MKQMDKKGYLLKDSYVFDDINLYTEMKSNMTSGMHSHDFYEFFYIIQGTVIHTINGEEEILGLGDLRFILPDETHLIRFKGSSLHRDIVIPKEYFEHLLTLLGTNKTALHKTMTDNPKTLSFKEINILENLANDFCNEASNLQKKRCFGLKLTNEILKLVFDNKQDESTNDMPIPFCVQYLIDNINTPEFFRETSIGGLIKRMGYSPSYVSHTFKKTIGTSISDYVKEKRVLHIEHYLRNTSYSLQEICDLVGLNNLSHLNNIFKEKYKISPIKYRKQHMVDANNIKWINKT